MAQGKLIGRGLTFPLQETGTGTLRTQIGGELIKDHIKYLLTCVPGERQDVPDYGCPVWKWIGSPLDASAAARAEHEIRECIEKWIPEVEEVNVTGFKNQKALVATIKYIERATRRPDSIVFPFYLQQET